MKKNIYFIYEPKNDYNGIQLLVLLSSQAVTEIYLVCGYLLLKLKLDRLSA